MNETGTNGTGVTAEETVGDEGDDSQEARLGMAFFLPKDTLFCFDISNFIQSSTEKYF
jgi:hypothetical protein